MNDQTTNGPAKSERETSLPPSPGSPESCSYCGGAQTMTPVCLHCGTIPIVKMDFDRLSAEVSRLRYELYNIANAKPSEWGDMSDQFQAWAQNRARHALANVKSSDGL